MTKFGILSASIAALGAAGQLQAQVPAKVTYADHILPIFRNACLNCHNPDKKKAGLDLSTYQGALAGSENGKVLESGNAGASLLFKCVKQIEEPKMPPKGDRLTDAELAIVEKWIAGQLLETATGKAVAASNNNVQVAVVSLERPEGPPPMPGDLPLEPVVRTGRTNALTALAASPWAPLVAVGGQKQIILYNTATLEPLGVLPFPEGFPAIIRFSRNGQLLLTGGGLGGKSGKVVLWDIKTGDRIATLGNEFDQVLAADLSADQQFVALGGPNKVVKIYSTKDGKLLHTMKKHTDWVTAIAYSADGRYLATADRNGGIQVWEGSTGKEFNALPGHKAMVTSLAFMTGVVASASEDGTVKLWDVKEAKEVKSWAAHPGGAAWVDFSPDGRLVSCGRNKVAKVWDQTGKELGKSDEFTDIALRAALSSERIIVGDWTGEIRVCSLDGKRIGELAANPPSIAERLTSAQKRLIDAQAALPGLQQRFAAAEQQTNAEKAAAAEKQKSDEAAQAADRKAEEAALAAAKALPAQIEKRLAEVKSELQELRRVRDAASETDRSAAQQRVDAQKLQIAQSEAQLAEARKQLDGRLANANKPQPATPAPPSPQIAELTKKLEQHTMVVAKLREARGSKTQGTPEYADADAKVQAKKKEIEQTQAALVVAQANPRPAAPPPSAAEQELAKAKTALDQTVAQISSAKADLDKWHRAEAFMFVHRAKETLAEKRSNYEVLVATIKEAMLPAEKIRADLVAAEKAVAEAPADVEAKELVLVQASQRAESISKSGGAAEVALAAKESEAKSVVEAFDKTTASAAELTKKLEQQNAEVAKLREARATKPSGSAEYADADAKVQAKKVEIAQTQAALEPAQAKVNELKPQAEPIRAEIAKARETLENARAEAKAATDKTAAAEKALEDARKNAEQAAARLVKLRKEAPETVKKAEAAKLEAEQRAVATAKEMESAKARLEQVQLDYESRWRPAERSSASPAAVASKS